jgi:pimeloyl-ACP methyl ester carboxylesterase
MRSLPKSPDAALREIYTATTQRLSDYNLFSARTIKTVATIAKKQAGYAQYQDFFADVHMPKPFLFTAEKGRGVPVVDIISAKGKVVDVIVLHLPMANPLDPNQLYHIATVAAAHPNYRVIAFGNPSGKPYSFRQQNLSVWQLLAVAFTNKLRSLVSVELDYLHSQKITKAHHVGYSYGAHKTIIETYYAEPGTVQSITLIDPVAHPRGFKQLIHDFSNTIHPLGEYVDRTRISSYFEARRDAAITKHHDAALRRPVNIAIGLLLRRLDFINMFEKVLLKHPNIFATVAWGGKSELGNNAHMSVSMHRLSHQDPVHVRAMRLPNDKHAFANDIHLYAAIIHEAISNSGKVE